MLEQKNHVMASYNSLSELYEKLKPIFLKDGDYTFTQSETRMLNQLFHEFLESVFMPPGIINDVINCQSINKVLACRMLLAKGIDSRSFTRLLRNTDFKTIVLPDGFFQRVASVKCSYIPRSNMRYIFDLAREFAKETDFINMLYTIVDKDDFMDIETFKHIFRNEDKTFPIGTRILFEKGKGYQSVIEKIKNHEIYSRYV